MRQNDTIEIRQEANGFVVIPVRGPSGPPVRGDAYVFQSFSELMDFLGEHFTHRNYDLGGD